MNKTDQYSTGHDREGRKYMLGHAAVRNMGYHLVLVAPDLRTLDVAWEEVNRRSGGGPPLDHDKVERVRIYRDQGFEEPELVEVAYPTLAKGDTENAGRTPPNRKV